MSSIAGWAIPHRLTHRRDLLRELVIRDMKLRYKRSSLGIAWTLANPLAQLLVYYFVFGVLFRVETPNYMAYIFIGLVSWNWLQAAVLESTMAILANRDLIRQPGFPSALLPNVTVGSHLIHFLFALPIVFALVIGSGIALSPALLWLPLVIAVQYVLTLAFALFAASIHVRFRDTQYLLGVTLMLAFFLTPILYEVTLVPEAYRIFYDFNPMTHVIDAYRAPLIHGQAPDLVALAVVAGLGLVLLRASYIVFQRASANFVDLF